MPAWSNLPSLKHNKTYFLDEFGFGITMAKYQDSGDSSMTCIKPSKDGKGPRTQSTIHSPWSTKRNVWSLRYLVR
jgi:hypothetical protein